MHDSRLAFQALCAPMGFHSERGPELAWKRLVIFGYPASEAIGGSLDLIIPQHLRAAHWQGYHQRSQWARPAGRKGDAYARHTQGRHQGLC